MSFAGSIMTTFAGQELALLPDRAVWWRAKKSLIVSDLHFGKAASFRATGVPVPSGATHKDLSRLDSLITATGADRLILLGDFLHSKSGRQAEVTDAITSWRERNAERLSILLVRGNHDRFSGRLPDEWNITQVEEPFVDGEIALTHDPECETDLPRLAGHVHPVATLRDYDGSSVRTSCFVFDSHVAILPAFGTFTGGHAMWPTPGRKIFILAGGKVILLPAET